MLTVQTHTEIPHFMGTQQTLMTMTWVNVDTMIHYPPTLLEMTLVLSMVLMETLQALETHHFCKPRQAMEATLNITCMKLTTILTKPSVNMKEDATTMAMTITVKTTVLSTTNHIKVYMISSAMALNTTCTMTTAGPIYSGTTTTFQDVNMNTMAIPTDMASMELVTYITMRTTLSLINIMPKCMTATEI